MVGCLTGMPLCYFVLRVIRNPFHLRGFISQVRLQIDPKIKKIEIICWATVLILLLWLLLMPLNDSSTIFQYELYVVIADAGDALGCHAFWLSLYLTDLDAGADCRDPFSLPLLTNLPKL